MLEGGLTTAVRDSQNVVTKVAKLAFMTEGHEEAGSDRGSRRRLGDVRDGGSKPGNGGRDGS